MTLTIHPPRGIMPILQFCLPSQLQIDPDYQRSTDGTASRTLINQMTRAWDWGLFQPLVVARRAGGLLYVIDGQHRLEAARQRGDIAQLPCVVTDYGDPREEATAFVALNQRRRPLTPLNVYRAAIAAGDADACAIDRLITGAGLKLTHDANAQRWKPGWINNIVSIQQSYRTNGPQATRVALEVLGAAFVDQVMRQCGTLFGMVVSLIARHHATLSTALLVDLLRERDADAWMVAIREAAGARAIGTMSAARALLAEAYAEAKVKKWSWSAADASGAGTVQTAVRASQPAALMSKSRAWRQL